MKKTLIFRAAIISMALLAFTACDEVKTYEKFSIAYTENSVTMQNDLNTFITEFCANYNQTKFNTVVMEKKTAQNLFNTFCADLKTQADGQGFKVFANTWATFQLQNTLREKIDEKKVEFTKTAEAKRYLSITFTEIAPNGDTDAATAFIESKLAPFSLTKETTTDTKGNVTNTYSSYKEYANVEEMQADYDTKKATLINLIDVLDNEWPANVLYTGKLDLVCICKDEGGDYIANISDNLICHKPTIIGKSKTWATLHTPDVPFDTIQFSTSATASIPFFVSYKATTKLNGITSTDYAYRQGIAILVMDEQSGKSKYGFKVLDTGRMQLIQKNGEVIADGPIYTKVAL